jgi:hypothetical protein
MRGLAKVHLYYGDIDTAVELFEDAFELDPATTSRFAARWLAASGHGQLAEEWLNRLHRTAEQ